MADVRECRYENCYYNNNNDSTCTLEKITVNPTGMCESLIHCDEYVCSECERFSRCTKSKKQEFLNEHNGSL